MLRNAIYTKLNSCSTGTGSDAENFGRDELCLYRRKRKARFHLLQDLESVSAAQNLGTAVFPSKIGRVQQEHGEYEELTHTYQKLQPRWYGNHPHLSQCPLSLVTDRMRTFRRNFEGGKVFCHTLRILC